MGRHTQQWVTAEDMEESEPMEVPLVVIVPATRTVSDGLGRVPAKLSGL